VKADVCIHVALFGLTIAVASGCDQPKPNCLTSLNPFVVKLYPDPLNPPQGACTGISTASFYADPHVGFAPFYERDDKGQPDYDKGSVGIRTAELANLVANVESRGLDLPPETVLHSVGKFSTEEPDANNLCTAPELSPTRVVLPALPAMDDDPATEEDESSPPQDAVDMTRTWSNVSVYVTPDSFGTQTVGDMQDVWRTPGGTCVVNYKAYGLSPAVSCQVTDEEGTPVREGEVFKVDPTLCDPEANPALNRFSGSGIGPSTNFECDPVIGYCVLAGTTFPALK
jgi:hypothetical protein